MYKYNLLKDDKDQLFYYPHRAIIDKTMTAHFLILSFGSLVFSISNGVNF